MSIADMFNNYTQWLRTQSCIQRPVGLDKLMYDDNVRIICVPFLNRHNDWFEIVVTPLDSGNVNLSDGGHMRFDMIENSELMDTEAINSICRGLGVANGECMDKQCTVDDFPSAFNMFCICLMKVSAVLECLDAQQEAAE